MAPCQVRVAPALHRAGPGNFPWVAGQVKLIPQSETTNGGPMGARQKGNPPRKRGPKPDTPVPPGKWYDNAGKGLKKPPPKGNWPEPPNKKGRGGR
jgi:hypothetical protein